MSKFGGYARGLALLAGVAVLSSCAAPQDDLTGSRLTQQQLPAGTKPPPADEAGDIAVAGQMAAHSILDLPQVANATTPPLVQFTGVTSIVSGPVPVDCDPYTTLLRDRLLLITRLKLRFIERELPPLVVSPSKKSKKQKASASTPEVSSTPEYEILAELHGRYDNQFYHVQIQFVDANSKDVLFNGLYKISKEATDAPPPEASPEPPPQMPPPQAPPPQAMPAGYPQ